MNQLMKSLFLQFNQGENYPDSAYAPVIEPEETWEC